jgi:hypothetical protein
MIKEKTGFYVSAHKELTKVMHDSVALGVLISHWREKPPRPMRCFMTFWDFDWELVKITLLYKHTAAKTLLRILFIIEKRLMRFERFKTVVNNVNETFYNRLQARAKARQAVAWYQFIWYGISERTWEYGYDEYDKKIRQKYLKEKQERRALYKKGVKT